MDVTAYLKRINYTGSIEANRQTLEALQMAHLLAVPFENLDIHLGRLIVLDSDRLYKKVVEDRRGGFCYELNGTFAELLRALGFRVTMIAAGVMSEEGTFGPDFDHLTLMVEMKERWLVDVGFGDSFRKPLLLDERGEQKQGNDAYRIDSLGETLTLIRLHGNNWMPQHRFTLRPRQLGDYAEMCHYHQTSPNSPFTQKRVCTIATPEGRITLSDRRLITTVGRERQERELATDEEYLDALREYFGVNITQPESLKK